MWLMEPSKRHAQKPAGLVYIASLRNAAADRAGQPIPFKGGMRYMKSPLEFLVETLNGSALGEAYALRAVIFDDDEGNPRDREHLKDYGFSPHPSRCWPHPPALQVQGRLLAGLIESVPSTYRRLPLDAPGRPAGELDFETRLLNRLQALQADVVVLDGLLVILDDLVRPGAPFHRRIANIHPGITREGSPHQRRGAWATLDALHGARGERIDWRTLARTPVEPVRQTGASFHYVDNGIDSGEVIVDVLATEIDPADTILELRWNNFHHSLFPALQQGLAALAARRDHLSS